MNKQNLLTISDLNVSLEKKSILQSFNLKINLGEIHVLMGPNGVGKSTLASILTGNHKTYTITGNIIYDKLDLLSSNPDILSLNGVFLSFQNPVEIPGLTNIQFFKSFINAKRKYEKLNPIDNKEFLLKVKGFMEILKIDEKFLYRSVNDGFSGGEKKRNEILQMLLLDPKLVILDEIDSGLDVDSLKIVFNALSSSMNANKSLLIITHYSRILDYINVDYVHVMNNGCIKKSGDKSLALDINKLGYSNL